MYIYNAAQIRNWDQFTIDKEPISSKNLMERAASEVAYWIISSELIPADGCMVLCGAGNNGGDGLYVASALHLAGIKVTVWLLDQEAYSADNLQMQQKCAQYQVPLHKVQALEQVQWPDTQVLIIDALFGTGLSRPVQGFAAELIACINASGLPVISIDMPSGLPADALVAPDAVVVQATHTLSFEHPKYAFFLAEHALYTGTWHLLPIGLHKAYTQSETSRYTFLTEALVQSLLPPARPTFVHKGLYGHALIMGGSAHMGGAAILSAEACLRSGVGLVSAVVPQPTASAMLARLPEVMCPPWQGHDTLPYTAAAVGMGWDATDANLKILQQLVCQGEIPLVLDASALRMIAREQQWLRERPSDAGLILTPHPGELAALAGKKMDSVAQIEYARNLAEMANAIVVLKGAYTRVITPGGLVYFNSTGNAGMAKGGSGDALSGYIAGWLAQGMQPIAASLLGVYVHGLAGDLAAEQHGQVAFTISDLIQTIPKAFQQVRNAEALEQTDIYKK